MNSNQEIDSLEEAANLADTDDAVTVDEFIRQLEAKEKDLHITAETTVIEIAESFDEPELPEFIKAEFPEVALEGDKQATATVSPPKKETSTNSRVEAENKLLKDKLAKLESDHAELVRISQRRSKDFANYKDRMDRERRETFRNQIVNLATQMLPALDNLNRAVDFAIELQKTEKSEFHQFFDGVVLVNQQVNEVLAGMGITPISTVGEYFDPHFHEAAATEESEEFEPNTITAEMLKGYRIGERVIRHSVVRVATALAVPREPSLLEKMIAEKRERADEPTLEDHPLNDNFNDLPEDPPE